MVRRILQTPKYTRTSTTRCTSIHGCKASPPTGATHTCGRESMPEEEGRGPGPGPGHGDAPRPRRSSASAGPNHDSIFQDSVPDSLHARGATEGESIPSCDRRTVEDVSVRVSQAVPNGLVREGMEDICHRNSSSFHLRAASDGAMWKEKSHSAEHGGVPKVLLLHHRMGYSIITLTESQRKLYKWTTLEKYLLYKGQKYSFVNVLGRFCVMLLIIYTFSTLFLAISMSTSSWLVLKSATIYESYSLFVSCRDQPLRLTVCSMYTLLKHYESLFPTLAVCAAKRSTQLKYAFVMLGVFILHIICQAIALFEVFWIAGRPTRSRTLLVMIILLCLCVFAGITNIALFPYSVQCERRACKAGTQRVSECEPHYGWGYRLYSAVIGINAFCALMSMCMYSYIYMIGHRISAQLEGERGRRCEHEAEQQYTHDYSGSKAVFDGDNDMNYIANSNSFLMSTEVKAFLAQTNTTLRDGRSNCYHLPSTFKNFQTPNRSGVLVHSPPHSSQNLRQWDAVQHLGNSSSARFSSTKNERNQMRIFFVNGERYHTMPNKEGYVVSDTLHRPSTMRAMPEHHLDTCSSLLGPVHGKEALPESALRPRSRGVEFVREGETVSIDKGQRPRLGECQISDAQHSDCAERRCVRKRRSALSRLFRWESDSDYITAAELGVQIDGANDWVYHDRSDMYYSFDRNMFWDPLTHEYYNCALKCWQEAPDQIVHTCIFGTTTTERKRRKVEFGAK